MSEAQHVASKANERVPITAPEAPPFSGWFAWLLVTLAALLGVRLLALAFNATDLFFDEAQYWTWATEPDLGYYSKPPLIAWIIALTTGGCGTSEFCIRLASPILHTLTGLAAGLVGWRLYGPQTGFWSGVVMATLPGVSLSASIISTDVPLLLLWAIALYAFVELLARQAFWPALLLGLAIGVGLNAKYAMAYFVLCALIFLFLTPAYRHIFRDFRFWAAVGIGLALIAPNLYWNYQNSFATFAHTADNANWQGVLFRANKALEFFAAQAGVFGPILFAALLIIVWRAWLGRLSVSDRLLLAFALPVIVIVTVQAFISRAHANWAAVSYVAAAILVTATMIRDVKWNWLYASLALHGGVVAILAVAMAFAGAIPSPTGQDPFARVLGWRQMANVTAQEINNATASNQPYAGVLTANRALTAEFLYYMRDVKLPLYAWRAKGRRPKDHYQLTRPFKPGVREPILLVSLRRDEPIARAFTLAVPLGERTVPTGRNARRRMYFWRVSGLREGARALPRMPKE